MQTLTSAQTSAAKALDDSSAELAQLNSIYAQTMQTEQKLSRLYHDLDQKVIGYERTASASSSDDLMQATKQMQQTEMSFNLQYLDLQQQMQREDQEFTTVSNIMKSKHDAAKNALQNMK
ncbi:MAG: hypothetical protein JO219_00295 [Candidatus Eremiobacteraeota bacterium]|nr:hypothetical protein [Candidatus Eremiobacteraeota bacterium]